MNKTDIPWADYSVNPVKGLCPMHCKDLDGESYCYARAMYHRFKRNPEIRYCPSVLHTFSLAKPGSRIFVGSTIELFGPWVKGKWLREIIQECAGRPWLDFIFLTKLPQHLRKYQPWPTNCWVGASATDNDIASWALLNLPDVDASVRFLSCEPLLEQFNKPILQDIKQLNWLILGGRTGRKKFFPPEEWIKEIEQAADAAGIPVFEKPNLRAEGPFRQEFPASREVTATP